MAFDPAPHDPSVSDPLPQEPLSTLARWLREARDARVQPNPDAMALATVGADGRPSLRLVLCRGFEPDPGYLVFYTNRNSRKGTELAALGYAAATFHWDTLQRQVRIEGPVVRSPDPESDAYFASRPRESQIAAWASQQSQPIASREALLARLAAAQEEFGASEELPIPRPPFWGGYRLWVESAELWVGSAGRAHDRARWQRRVDRGEDGLRLGPWGHDRLQP